MPCPNAMLGTTPPINRAFSFRPTASHPPQSLSRFRSVTSRQHATDQRRRRDTNLAQPGRLGKRSAPARTPFAAHFPRAFDLLLHNETRPQITFAVTYTSGTITLTAVQEATMSESN